MASLPGEQLEASHYAMAILEAPMTTDRYHQILNDISESMNYDRHSKAEYRECIKRLMELETAWIARYNAVRGDLMEIGIMATKAFHADHPNACEIKDPASILKTHDHP